MQFLVIFDLHFKDVICIILTFFLFFWFPWSQEITFYIFIMAVAYSCGQEKKMKILIFFENLKNLIFFENLKNLKIFKKNSKFSFFLLFTAMCYHHSEDIKSYFLTSRKPKNKKKVKIMHIKFLNWRSKMIKNCIFLIFFPKTIVKIDTSACKIQNFAMSPQKTKSLGTLEQFWYLYHFHSSKTQKIRGSLLSYTVVV